MSDQVITTLAPEGRHIPLRCKNHPDRRWSTKNILYIGARRIFYNLDSVAAMGPECDCPTSLLEVVEDEITPN